MGSGFILFSRALLWNEHKLSQPRFELSLPIAPFCAFKQTSHFQSVYGCMKTTKYFWWCGKKRRQNMLNKIIYIADIMDQAGMLFCGQGNQPGRWGSRMCTGRVL